ncbi:MAG: SulP family inorganic anion transporter [Ignavibacteriota bacterium]
MSPPRANYRWNRFVGDCAGGLIAALIALPYGLALATAMGLPPVLGIFTSILTAPVICLMGRNPVLIGAPPARLYRSSLWRPALRELAERLGSLSWLR